MEECFESTNTCTWHIPHWFNYSIFISEPDTTHSVDIMLNLGGRVTEFNLSTGSKDWGQTTVLRKKGYLTEDWDCYKTAGALKRNRTGLC